MPARPALDAARYRSHARGIVLTVPLRGDLVITRRTFLTGTTGAILATARIVEAQPGQSRRLGILYPSGPPQPTTEVYLLRLRAELQHALRTYGWTEGQNLIIERRYASGDLDRLSALADELVALKVDVIYATTGRAGLAAKNATTRIPIVTQSGDMARQGLVSSVARPGGNVTGQNVISADDDVVIKRLHLLSELLSRPSRIAVLGCGLAGAAGDTRDNWAWPATESAARTLNLHLRPYSPKTLDEIEEALKDASKQADALLLFDCSYFNALHSTTFLKHRLPAMYPFESFAHLGGLMAYGFDEISLNRRHAWYIDRILRGAKPADLPVEQASLRFVINLSTAKALGLTIPPSLLLRADQVIE
jgi:putative tryptophan/tyrosine transport system substrate-binding protein